MVTLNKNWVLKGVKVICVVIEANIWEVRGEGSRETEDIGGEKYALVNFLYILCLKHNHG